VYNFSFALPFKMNMLTVQGLGRRGLIPDRNVFSVIMSAPAVGADSASYRLQSGMTCSWAKRQGLESGQ
jgi:hypothetical protein